MNEYSKRLAMEARVQQRKLELAARVEEFYNKSHQQSGADGGQFVEGSDGPGRKRDPGKEDLGKPGINQPAKKGAKATTPAKTPAPAESKAPVKKVTEEKPSAKKAPAPAPASKPKAPVKKAMEEKPSAPAKKDVKESPVSAKEAAQQKAYDAMEPIERLALKLV